MGIDVRWFNHDKREYIDPADLPANDRYYYAGGRAALAFQILVRDKWNGDKIEMIADTSDRFFELPRAGYRHVVAELRPLVEAREAEMHAADEIARKRGTT